MTRCSRNNIVPPMRPKRVRADSRKGMKLFLVALPTAMHRQLSKIKKQTGATMNDLVRRAVESWLKAQRPK